MQRPAPFAQRTVQRPDGPIQPPPRRSAGQLGIIQNHDAEDRFAQLFRLKKRRIVSNTEIFPKPDDSGGMRQVLSPLYRHGFSMT
mgnify:CR=1 FL=1